MAKSAQRLRQLLNELLSAARPVAGEIRSLGRLAAEIQYIDSGKAREAAVYLTELGYSGAAVRLTEDVGQLRQKADEAFREPFVAEPTPDDRRADGCDLRPDRIGQAGRFGGLVASAAG